MNESRPELGGLSRAGLSPPVKILDVIEGGKRWRAWRSRDMSLFTC